MREFLLAYVALQFIVHAAIVLACCVMWFLDKAR